VEKTVSRRLSSCGYRICDWVAPGPPLSSTDELQSEVAESDHWCCCRHDPQFPGALQDVPGSPRALFGRGDPLLLASLCTDNAVAIVGARRASSYGREVARTLGRDLAHAGLTVISGLAFGIDACAHRGAVEGGTTVAVLAAAPTLPIRATTDPFGGASARRVW
jgi:DNA processing protein